ncbi:hypothetical protein K440DRAFT_659149 [Wilcoxina mikolae CBS 423.85]|nr:hypothetical protein K440DRAFT_659149 [Wilcoxina mikolae CBS 423.85]
MQDPKGSLRRSNTLRHNGNNGFEYQSFKLKDDGAEDHPGDESDTEYDSDRPLDLYDDNTNELGPEWDVEVLHKTLIEDFETEFEEKKWQKLSDSDMESEVAKFMEVGSRTLCADKGDGDLRTLLHSISKKNIAKRSGLFKWLMIKYPDLYQQKDNSSRNVLSSAVQRLWTATRVPKKGARQKSDPIQLRCQMDFIEYFVSEFPRDTAELLDMNVLETDSGDFLIHQLVDIRSVKLCTALLPILHNLKYETVICPDKNGNTLLHLVSAFNFAPAINFNPKPDPEILKPIQFDLVEKIISLFPNALTDEKAARNKAGESPYRYRVSTFRKSVSRREKSEKVSTRPPHEDKIAELLKDWYMHLKRDEAIEYLYEDGPECAPEIHFDLMELENIPVDSAVGQDSLKGLITRLNFETILQYVRLNPPFSKPRGGEQVKANGYSCIEGIGRKDFESMFNLLANKGVKKIIKLMVTDDKDIPHSDVVIEELKKFEIEDWDWRKVDLCCETLFKAAPNARKITLYSSRNNAVLRSWSGTDGLNMFGKLKEVVVFINRRLESEERTKDLEQKFGKRMTENCSNVEVECRILDDTGTNENSDTKQLFYGPDNASTNAWLKTMDDFARFFRNIPMTQIPKSRHPEIKVAVIDDGIDWLDPEFSDCISGGVTFYTPVEAHSPCTKPYYFSSSGHGTLMAKTIRRVCPKARLYIARLEEGQSEGRGQPTAESAVKAIRWAIRMKVDIISMSWTIARTGSNSEFVAALEESIRAAHDSGILMFGAASDEGFNTQNPTFPASLPGVICIGAADPSGQAENAAAKEAQFVFPGGEAGIKKLSRHPTLGGVNPDHASGSSFATAVAGGLAALILCCFEIVGKGKSCEMKLRKHAAMVKIFEHMADKIQPKYPVVSTFFDNFAKIEWCDSGEGLFNTAVEKILRPVTDDTTLTEPLTL